MSKVESELVAGSGDNGGTARYRDKYGRNDILLVRGTCMKIEFIDNIEKFSIL